MAVASSIVPEIKLTLMTATTERLLSLSESLRPTHMAEGFSGAAITSARKSELRLLEIEPLSVPAELAALQLLYDQP